jgi:hypothetical protein
MASITTDFNVGQWIYGYTGNEAYSGEVESISVSAAATTEIRYKITGRTTLVLESDLEANKAALDASMIVRENAANESKKSATSSVITSLPTS